MFDLGTSPNNTLLVADVPRGVSIAKGVLLYSLARAASIAPIYEGVIWVGPDVGEVNIVDSGQFLYRINNVKNQLVTNVFQFEAANNSDGYAVDSNPYAVAALSANDALVADSGANDLLRVNNKEAISVVAGFTNLPLFHLERSNYHLLD